MNLPGENTITLTDEALRLIVEEALNEGRHAKPRLRVTGMSRAHSYDKETQFTVTTDAPEPDPSSVFVRPQLEPMPEPDPPVLLPASVGGIPL